VCGDGGSPIPRIIFYVQAVLPHLATYP
jgi:hypothetical protein